MVGGKQVLGGLAVATLALTGCSQAAYSGTPGNPVSAPAQPPTATSAAGMIVQGLLNANDVTVRATLLVDYTATTDPELLLGKPGQYVAAASFTDDRCDRSLAGDSDGLVITHGGIVEIWPDATSAQSRIDAFTRLRDGNFLRPDETDVVSGRVVLRLCRGLRQPEIDAYKATLDTLSPADAP